MYTWEKKFDELALSKGKQLKENGRVERLRQDDKSITGEVSGNKRYEVTIALRDGEPVRMKCHCPKYAGGSKCEHIAAVLYAAYGYEADKKRQEEEKKRREEARKKKEAEERKKQEEERKARREKKVQEAIERAKNKEKKEPIEKEREESVVEAEIVPELPRRKKIDKKKYQSWNPEQDIVEGDFDKKARRIEEAYSYFNMNEVSNSMKLKSAQKKRGKQLALAGNIQIRDLKIGYASGISGQVIEAYATGVEGGNSFPIYLSFSRDRVLRRECGCQECRKRFWFEGKAECAYGAGLLEVLGGYLTENRIGDATDDVAADIIHSLMGIHENEVIGEIHTTENSLQLVPKLVERGEFLEVSFRIGEKKLFVVKNLYDLCERVEQSETAVYGSKTEINHQIRNFTESGLKWYNFIRAAVEQEYQMERHSRRDGYGYESGMEKGRILLYGRNLDEFYKRLGDEEIEYEKKNDVTDMKGKQRIRCMDAIPKVVMHIKKEGLGEKVFHGVHVSCRMPVFFQGLDASYYVEEGRLCRTDASHMEKLKILTDRAEDGRLEFVVGRANLSEFYYTILPEFEDVVEIRQGDMETIEDYLPPQVRFLFYLDADEHDIICRVFARYGNAEESIFDLLDESALPLKRYRMVNKEAEIMYLVSRIFTQQDMENECFRCGGEEGEMYEVLQHGVPRLMELGEVLYTKKFHDLFAVKKMKVSIGVSMSQGLLNLDIVTDDLSGEELLEVLKSYRAKKKYFRMKNGDFMSLEEDSIEALEELMHALDLTPKELAQGQVKCPAYRAVYLDKLLGEHEEIYNTRDSHFREMVKNFKTINDADYEVPASLENTMRGYQKNGYRWLRTLEENHFGGILADDMGLGKTLQAISLLQAAKEEQKEGTSLIVSPASLVFNWGEEFGRFAPEMKVLVLTGTQQERREMLESYLEYDVIVTSYDLLKRDITNYDDKRFLFQIIDEAQYIKNHTTAVAKAVKVIQSEYRFAMTGTPIENRLSELWSIFDYLMPGFLYSYEVFKRDLELPIVKYQDEAAMKRLQKMAGTFILRRLKQDVLKDLPEKLEETRYVKMDKEQQRLYDAQVVHMRNRLEQQGDDEFRKNKMLILAELTKLRQICCDPSLCFENYNGESAKLESCIDLVQTAIDGGHKILLFSQFTSMLDIIQERLQSLGIAHYVITGATPKEKRLQMVKAFNQDETPVFLISLKAGGVGLNLTGADVVIHYDPWWNLAVQNQATDRAHRIGQKNKVVVYKVIMKHSIEEKIQKLQETKKDLADQIVNADTGQIGNLSREEMLELLGV